MLSGKCTLSFVSSGYEDIKEGGSDAIGDEPNWIDCDYDHMVVLMSHIDKMLRGSSSNSNWLSPISLLERFREAVFRLIMLSALSKATHHSEPVNVPRAYNPLDPHHSEAVADCIEFIKKSALADESRDSTASSSVDVTEVVLPALPVM
ncbi:hypothetical protein HHK36_002986 [Tetracentron sinense]|uniref:Uncharacterized protein n=1 Tax=Tetracentron sinense TaxID=13715 RepID=A0A834ZQE2_TETSI|nr:hypothetical protein HHK36_002986 [Tetracentron sinense]